MGGGGIGLRWIAVSNTCFCCSLFFELELWQLSYSSLLLFVQESCEPPIRIDLNFCRISLMCYHVNPFFFDSWEGCLELFFPKMARDISKPFSFARWFLPRVSTRIASKLWVCPALGDIRIPHSMAAKQVMISHQIQTKHPRSSSTWAGPEIDLGTKWSTTL